LESESLMPTNLDSLESGLRDARPSAARAQRIVAGAMERSQRDAWRWRVPAIAFGTALAAAIILGLWRGRAPGIGDATIFRSGAVADATEAPRTVRAGLHEIRVEVDSELVAERIDENATELKVVRGAATFRVHHLEPGQRFWVTAGGVTVEAIGTQFAVAVEGPCVRVEVSEGKVEVRRVERPSESLAAGNSHVYCQRPQGPEVLTDEERLIFGALGSLRLGGPQDLERAAGLLKEYEQRFPGGAYQEEALYYLTRISQRLGHIEEARGWAKSFLGRFPQGRRASEVRAVLASGNR
jgi:hypothetical protein